jgi:hypothetical protein
VISLSTLSHVHRIYANVTGRAVKSVTTHRSCHFDSVTALRPSLSHSRREDCRATEAGQTHQQIGASLTVRGRIPPLSAGHRRMITRCPLQGCHQRWLNSFTRARLMIHSRDPRSPSISEAPNMPTATRCRKRIERARNHIDQKIDRWVSASELSSEGRAARNQNFIHIRKHRPDSHISHQGTV